MSALPFSRLEKEISNLRPYIYLPPRLLAVQFATHIDILLVRVVQFSSASYSPFVAYAFSRRCLPYSRSCLRFVCGSGTFITCKSQSFLSLTSETIIHSIHRQPLIWTRERRPHSTYLSINASLGRPCLAHSMRPWCQNKSKNLSKISYYPNQSRQVWGTQKNRQST